MLRTRAPVLTWLIGLAAFGGLCPEALANDAMFPAQTAAASSIGWSKNYFLVKGQPTIVSAGEIHYARVPRELWRERLVKMKRAGFNTVSTYVFWNAQEPAPGVFDLTDNLDLDAWLTMIEDVGLYAIVRPGPYNCAEWLAGGIPQWITSKGLSIRNDSADYLALADAYYEKILPIIAKHQIHKDGSVLFVQLENEHPAGWGTEANAYLTHLYNKARSLGLEVPLFYSGLHHATDPAGGTPFGNRTYPWFSTEFWSGWYSPPFGEMNANDLNVLTRGAWKVIAFGGGGNSFYVFHGGTNFGYEGDTATTSYDYRAPLGEAGQLRQGYFGVRGPASFSRTFEPLMATSQDGGNVATVATGLKAYVRKSPSEGTAVFLDNQGTASVATQVKLSSPAVQFPAGNTQITVAANEIRPVVVAARWTANATLAYLATNVLGKLTLGTKTYYVLHGRAGEAGEIAIQYGTAPTAAPAEPIEWDATSKLARATFKYPTGDNITELALDSGDGAFATFLVVNTALANRTWFTDKALYVGGTYIEEDLSIQAPLAGGKVVVYSAAGRSEVSVPAVNAPPLPTFGSWQWRDAAAEAAPSYDDSTWASSTQPQPFGANNFQNGYGWYRAKFTATTAGNVTAKLGGMRTSALAFANGKLVTVSNNSVTFSAIAGENTLAFLAKHEGLDKVYNVTGATDTLQYAGIWGGVTSGGAALAPAWKFRGGLGAMDETAVVGRVKNWTTFLGGTWADAQTTKSWPAFFRASFKSPLQPTVFATLGLRTSGLSSGSVWVNGHNIGRFSGNTLLYVPEGWLSADNTVVLYDASGNAPTGVKFEYIETRARVQASQVSGAGGVGGSGGATGIGGTASSNSVASAGNTARTSTSTRAGSGGAATTSGTVAIVGTGGTTRASNATSGIIGSNAGGSSSAVSSGSGGTDNGSGSTRTAGGSLATAPSGSATTSASSGAIGGANRGGSHPVGDTAASSRGDDRDPGCACRVESAGNRASNSLLAAGIAAFALRLRRRKRRSEHR